MAKRKPTRTPSDAPSELGQLTGRSRELASHMLTSIALENYDECCSLEELARLFKTTPARLKPAIRKLEQAGLVTLAGDIFPTAYPTTKLLRQQDPRLSERQAAAILKRVRRA
jgi:hypothetical protein